MHDRKKLADFFIEKLKASEMDIHHARQEMEKSKLPEDEIKAIMRILDREIIQIEIVKLENRRARELVLIGYVLTGLGLIITLGTFIGFIPMGDSFLLTIGPLAGGLSILFSGLAKRRR
jgi:hypothetical protein